MAINKTINRSSKSKAGMRNCIEYVLRAGKTDETLIYMTGPSPDELSWNNVYNAFMDEKQIWNKLGGRLYNHNVISFHENERISPEEALEFGKDFAEKWFPNHQSVIAVHTDRNHVHIHIVTNSVSYVDGRKLHNSKNDLQRMKDFTNQMCKDRGLTIAEKGRHFNGEKLEAGELSAWSKDKYNMLKDTTKKSYVVDCAAAILSVLENICYSVSDFVAGMKEQGWTVNWNDNRKNITFENQDGNKVRDTNISKTFNMNVGKEVLIREFEQQVKARDERTRAEQEQRRRDSELEQYYAELEGYIETEDSDRRTEDNNSFTESRSGFQERGNTNTSEAEIREFIDNLNAKERTSAENRENREAEQRRLDFEREREARERDLEREKRARAYRKKMQEFDIEL